MLKRILLIIAVFLTGLFLGLLYYFNEAFYQPVAPKSQASQIVKIEKTSTPELADQLFTAGLIKSKIAFETYVKFKKMSLQTGQYELSPAQSIATIAHKIASGDIVKFKVTIPEGWRLTQIADRLAKREVVARADFLAAAEGQEGYLFPDTYLIPAGTSAQAIVAMMKQDFQSRTSGLAVTPDIIILASIIEREVSATDDRSQIAAVYTNRLKQGMKLQADPTVQYAKGSWAAIKQSDYQNTISDYNTYLHEGLPPGPICNPGLASIEAALHPATHDYLFFFHTSDGRTIFSKTYDEHSANLAKYRAGTL